MVAIEQWRSGELFVRGWYYSQDFWPMFVFNSVTLLFPIIGDAFLATQIGVFFQTLVIFLITRKILLSIQTPVITNLVLAFLLSGVSSLWSEFFFGQGQYGNVLMFLLLEVFLILNVLQDSNPKKIKILLATLFLINCYVNSTSIRYLPMMVAPAFAALGFLLLTKQELSKRTCWIAGVLLISTAIGQISFVWLKNSYTFLSGVDGSTLVSYAQAISNNIPRTIDGYFSLIVDSPIGIKFASLKGALFLERFIFSLIFFSAPFYFLFSKCRNTIFQYDASKQFLIIYFATLAFISFFSVVFLSSTVNFIAAARYIMIAIYFGVFVGLIYANFYKTKNAAILLMIALVPILLHNTLTLNRGLNHNGGERQQLANFLMENKLERGFASYWNADVITVLSNYKVMVSHIEGDQLKPSLFMSSKEFYKPVGAKENFLLLDGGEAKSFNFDWLRKHLGEPTKVLTFKGYFIYVYKDEFATRLPGWFN
jgi:hypothetical protein